MAGIYERLSESLHDGKSVEEIPPPRPLIEGVIDHDSVAAIYGRSGIGKSAVAHSMALSLCSGRPWFGHRVHQASVLYVVAEGQAGIGGRQIAWRKQHGLDSVENITYMTVAPNLMMPEDRMAILRLVDEIGPMLTIFDTLARHIPGGDENTGPAMSVVVETLEEVKRITEGCAMVVHHTGWSDGERLRGHSSLEGALDHAFAILPRQAQSPDGRIKVRAHKHKNHPDHYTLARLHLVEKAGAVTVVEDVTLSGSERETLDTLISLVGETNGQVPEGIQSHAWEQAVKVSRATFFRCRSRLLDLGEVIEDKGKWRSLT